MSKVLVLYYSSYGHIEKMAEAVAEGVREAGAEAVVKRVPELVPEEIARKSHFKLDQAAPIASVAELPEYDAIILGVPTRFGNMPAQMKNFLDQTGGLWAQGKLIGKVGSVFTSTATQHGGQESTILSTHTVLLHHGNGACRFALFLSGPDGREGDRRRLALRRVNDRRRRWLATTDGERAGRCPLPGPACGSDRQEAGGRVNSQFKSASGADANKEIVMSWNPALEPGCPDAIGIDAIETLIIPRARDLGDFEVRRALPAPKRQMVGPFIFFDQAGPAEFVTGKGVDVRPHPHIGLATVTYLYRGEFQHRDSLGTNQIILPGAVNWMVAGRGVTHSERTSAATRNAPHSLYGIQTWVALPEGQEDVSPSFEHHGTEALPVIESDGVNVRLILGRAYGKTAPASIFSDTFYADVALQAGMRFPLPDDHEDRGLYIVEGSVSIAGRQCEAAVAAPTVGY